MKHFGEFTSPLLDQCATWLTES